MAQLHEALACLRPKDFSDVPIDALESFLPGILANAEIIANSVPPPPDGMPYESSQRTRTSSQPAQNAADLTISKVRRPPPAKEHAALQKSWGSPLKMAAKEAATGISVFKMAGHDRHGAWFARTGITEGLGFAKWKRAMLSEFPESLAVQGGPGEGNVRGIGGDQRLEDIVVDGVGKLEVYQLSAQFPGPTSPREFITLLITSDNCLSDASKVGNTVPRHFMVVSIPVSHPDAPPRTGLVRGYYESIEMIREIPLASANDGDHDMETNPVEWIMVTRSDPGGGIPRFMVERSVPSSIVQDAVKFLDWACAKSDADELEVIPSGSASNLTVPSELGERRRSITESNGIMAGVGTSIADKRLPDSLRLRADTEGSDAPPGYCDQFLHAVEGYVPDALSPLHRTISSSSSSTVSSADSFASAEQFRTAEDGLPLDNTITSPSSTDDSPHAREMQKIDERKRQLREKLDQAREKRAKDILNNSEKTQKEIEKAAEKHRKERKKQEEKFEREIRKLEKKREKETQKLLARQQKEADKDRLSKAQRERDEEKQRAVILDEENKLLRDQIGELQKEKTALIARLGKTEAGRDILRLVREEEMRARTRASSRASGSSGRKSVKSKAESEHGGIVRSDTHASKS